MAITFTEKVTASSTTNASPYTVGSYAYQNNLGYLLLVASSGTANVPTPTVAGTTSAHAWVNVTSEPFSTNAAPSRILSLYRMLVTSGATTETLTITITGTPSGCSWHVIEVTGMDTSGSDLSGAIVQSAVNFIDTNAQTLTATLSAVTAGNAFFGGFTTNQSTTALTAGTNFTAGTNTAYATPTTEQNWEYNLAPSSVSVIMNTTTNGNWAGLAVEIKAAAAATGPVGFIPI